MCRLKLSVSYDKTFSKKFGNDVTNAVRRTVAQASALLKLKSLTTQIDLSITEAKPLTNLSWRAEDNL